MQQGKAGTPIVYYVFDVLEVEGAADRPAVDGAQRLAALLDKRNRPFGSPRPSTTARRCFTPPRSRASRASRHGRVALPAGKRGRDWLKIKTHGRQEFVICGYTRGQGKRASGFGALILGVYRGSEPTSATSAPGSTRRRSASCSTSCGCSRPARRRSGGAEDAEGARDAIVWVEPKLVCEVCSASGRMTAAAPACVPGATRGQVTREVRHEGPIEDDPQRQPPGQARTRQALLADEGITKGDLLGTTARSRRSCSRTCATAVHDEALPDGWQGNFFFQADAPRGMPEWIKRVRIKVSTHESPRRAREIDAPLVNDELSLL